MAYLGRCTQVLVTDIALSALILLGSYLYLTKLCSPSIVGAWPPKRKAWIISAVTSFLCSLLSAKYVYLLTLAEFDTSAALYTDDRLSRFMTTFFTMSMVLDLSVGMIEYRSQIQLLSGWVHHIMYIGLASWTLIGNFSRVSGES